MQLSSDRILTTHAGSLRRGSALSKLLVDEEKGETVDDIVLVAKAERRVAHVLIKQHDIGIDIPADGEQPRVGFQTDIT